jgi:hypothetical protein
MSPDPVMLLNMSDSLGVIVQLFIGFCLIFYLVYAFLMLRQVSLLNRSFHTEAARLISLVAYIHFMATLFLLLFTILVTVF